MNVYQSNAFSGETIDLDGSAFRQCSFEDCSLRFSAAGPTELNGCTFTRSHLVADGAASMTLSYLRGFYQGLGEWGRNTVDGIFEAIRRPDPSAEPAPSTLAPTASVPGVSDLLLASYRAALEDFGATPEGQTIVRGFARLSPSRRQEIAALIGLAARQQ